MPSKFTLAFKGQIARLNQASTLDVIEDRFKEKGNDPILPNPKDKKNTERFEMILFWDPYHWPKHKFKYQRLGFKAPTTMLEACKEAQRLALLLGNVATKPGMPKGCPVEVCAVYRAGSFQDWSQENKYAYGDANSFIKETLTTIQQDKLKDIKVSTGGFSVDTKRMKMVR